MESNKKKIDRLKKKSKLRLRDMGDQSQNTFMSS